ncbi:MAG: hypothetical protein GT598_11180 [Bacteroidales bacterium]|nr:hypothetical protein [Bacteroidales bacterium]HQG76183.1 hypothetical protein [Bacteroidales bacterium]
MKRPDETIGGSIFRQKAGSSVLSGLKNYIMDAYAPENAGPDLKIVTAGVIAGKTVLRE